MNIPHTPGPWTAAVYTGKYDQPLVTAYSGGHICRVTSQDDRVHEANARLIAAAPDLLVAAQKIIATWEGGDLAAAVRDLSVAVAKAGGL